MDRQSTHLDVLGKTGGFARFSHVYVETVPGRPIVHPSGWYDHNVLDATAR